ncbi:MAG: 16S rRNA (cytosine(967)-C(5))-methyltransferase RsmB [Aquimonas sp.]|nr:16S rRNA (cytosine(967)-C(5))-methyltransferase RsmB [Aquimonas sp.]
MSRERGPAAVPGAEVRAVAARVLAEVLSGRSLKAQLAQQLTALPDSRDRALCEAICHAALRRRLRYEAALAQLLERPIPPKARHVFALLLVGLAQLDALQMVPHAAVAATAEAARTLGFPGHVGLVNALLRRVAREPGNLLAGDTQDEARRSHPTWLREAIERDWPEHAPAIFQANLEQAPLWLRLQPAAADGEAFIARLQQSGVRILAQRGAALAVENAGDPARLPGFAEGAFLVQDYAAQQAVEALAPEPGQRALDACAAPGGKAAQIAASGAHLLAVDSDARRLRKVGETLQRLGLAGDLKCADAADTAAWWDGQPFERILIDAPCTATGVIRRQPDILLHRRSSDLPARVAEQARLLRALWPLLATGGRLVYATCSVLKDENERQIDAFLAAHAEARALDLPDALGRPAGAGRQRLPGEEDGDGFFIAALVKD